jgi:hypothetical protein
MIFQEGREIRKADQKVNRMLGYRRTTRQHAQTESRHLNAAKGSLA